MVHVQLGLRQAGDEVGRHPWGVAAATIRSTRSAVEAGASEADVADGIKAGENDFAKGATKQATDAGVQGTPTVLVDGETFNYGTDPQKLVEELEK